MVPSLKARASQPVLMAVYTLVLEMRADVLIVLALLLVLLLLAQVLLLSQMLLFIVSFSSSPSSSLCSS